MRAFFSLISLCLMACCSSIHAQDCQKGELLVIPTESASQVFVGGDMPKDGCYLLNVVDSDRAGAPKDEGEAIDRVVKSLPAWLYVAVGLSSGDTECVVQVNKLDYFDLVVSMWVERWRKNEGVKPSFLGSRTFEGDPGVDRLQEDSCRRIKEQMRVGK